MSQRSSVYPNGPVAWIFNHYAGFPEDVPATRTYELSRELQRRGWNVTVIACSFNHYTFVDDLGADGSRVQELLREGVRWVRIRAHPYEGNGTARLRNMLGYSSQALNWSRRQSPPDVVVGTTVHPFAAETARRVARERNARFVYEITDLWPESLVDLGSVRNGSATYRAMSWMERRALTDSDGVVGLMPKVPEYARSRYGVELDSFAYIPNGIRLTEDGEDVTPIPMRGRVAYAGGFARAHGLDTVIDAAGTLLSSHPHITFDLYGDGPMRRDLEDRVLRNRLSNVVFHGLVPKASLWGHLREADVCLCTGQSLAVHRYGISFNKLFDYFAVGRPVVFAVDSGNDPVTEAGAGLSVAAGDAAALAAAIADLIDSPADVLQHMGHRGRAFLQAHHSFSVLGERLDGYLWTLLKANDGLV
ncbi:MULTISPECIES: glycosyltransferase family 4 protein [unclassified Nocardioides]|uniref:glycosyltransferase family 4 protein n=1 Tax=unclassified Nocardioides TaxID=2615069 RepID=UPI000056F51E|nr:MULTISPECIES: glycosyltransferase family 4 protein [unclassified Nocardioides]ABL83714.1 glycosyl transferase, group 1 [Nocardioides sp. JS614]